MTDVTKIDWMTLAEPNEEWEAAVAQLPQRPDFGGFTEISTLRGYIMQAKRKALQSLPPLPNIEIKDHQMPTRDGSEIAVRTYTPIGKTDSPLLVIFHGGGFCIGGLDSEEVLCRRATSELGYVTVNVDYRLAPEHKFPTAVYDCHDATKWAAANASALGADPSKGFVLGGTSAGAGLTLTSTLLTRDEGMTPKVTGCHLMIPPLCASTAVPDKYKADYRSWDQNENADILSRKACELFSTNYTRSPEDYSSPMFSPLLWETGFKDFPATNFQICGADPLRDEGLIFERLLREDEKVKTRVELYPGLPHGFYSVMPTLKVSKKYADDSVAGLKWLQA